MTQTHAWYAVLIALHSDIVFPQEVARGYETDRTVDRAYALARERCVIGRNSAVCDIYVRPERRDVSREHAVIIQRGSRYLLEDCASRHGTFVNGRRITSPRELATGDVLGFAGTKEMLLFRDPRTPEPTLAEPLTDRELEVLRLVAVGRTNQEIAAELTIAVDTVKTRLRNIFQKLGVDRRTEAVHEAQRRQLL
jgi:DNA-binding CsgD family transcriptional regulator